MTLEERAEFVLTTGKALFVNGQSTEQTFASAQKLAAALGMRAELLARWGELALQVESRQTTLVRLEAAEPTGVDMDRVASATRVIDKLASARLDLDQARAEIDAVSHAPSAPTWMVAIAAAAGAAALSVIFGVHHLTAATLIGASAGAGALLRRALAQVSGNIFLQPFCAALLAGVVGALAVRYHLSSSLRLVAVCPCMVLVPGPHVLNGGLDLIRGRIHLGAARIIFACLVVAAISTGLLFGLSLFGAALPVEPPGRTVPLWEDVAAAGVAVAAYTIFFSTPLRMLPWPVVVGMFAHGLRWAAMTGLGFGPAGGALVACMTVGLTLTPVAYRSRMPFAAIGFASVVSMMPGVFVFRMASGLVQIVADPVAASSLVAGALADGMTAVTIVLAICLGLLAPKLIIDRLAARSVRRGA
jgi:uncharacterized membrane protein YjjP (DUF1212 family)